MNKTIAVAGVRYVGLSLAVLLAQHNKVYAVSTTPAKIDLINNRKAPIQDDEISEHLATKDLDLTATLDKEMAIVRQILLLLLRRRTMTVKRTFSTPPPWRMLLRLC